MARLIVNRKVYYGATLSLSFSLIERSRDYRSLGCHAARQKVWYNSRRCYNKLLSRAYMCDWLYIIRMYVCMHDIQIFFYQTGTKFAY